MSRDHRRHEAFARFTRVLLGLSTLAVVLAVLPLTTDPSNDIKTLILGWTALAVIALRLALVYNGAPPLRSRPLALILACFVGLSLISAAFSQYRLASLPALSYLAALTALFLSAESAYREPRQVEGFLTVFCVAMVGASLYAFLQRYGWDPLPWDESVRELPEYRNLPSTFGNPNFAGHALALAITACAGLVLSKRARWWALALLPVFAVYLVLTRQRAGLVAVASAALLWLVALAVRRRPWRTGKAVIATLSTVAVVGVLLAGTAAGWHKAAAGHWLPVDASLLLRYNSYYGASRMIVDRPVLGSGPGSYVIENARYWTPYEQEHYARARKVNGHVHCEPLEAGVTLGLPGLALYVILLVTGVTLGLRLWFGDKDRHRGRLGLAFAAAFCAFFVDGLFGFNMHTPVSGAVLFILAGQLSAMWTQRTAGTRRRNATHTRAAGVALTGLALCGAVVTTLDFRASLLSQYGAGAMRFEAFDVAARSFARAWRTAPWRYTAAHQEGRALALLGRNAEAVAAHEKALARNPYFLPSLNTLAQLEFNLGRAASENPLAHFERAGELGERALALCAGLPETHDIKGRLAYMRYELASPDTTPWEDAEELLTEAIQHFRTSIAHGSVRDAKLYVLLAHLNRLKGNPDEASAWVHRALAADPANEQVWEAFLEVAQSANDWSIMDNALRDGAAAGAPASILRAWEMRGLVARNAPAGEVLGACVRMVRAEPDDPRNWELLTAYALPRGEDELMWELARDMAREVPESHPMATGLRAVALLDDGGMAELANATELLAQNLDRTQAGWALEVLARASRLAPVTTQGLGEAHFNLGAMFEHLGLTPRGGRHYETALQLLREPRLRTAALFRYAQALDASGETAEAALAIREANGPETRSFDVQMLLGDLLVKLGRTTEARFTFESVRQTQQLTEAQGRMVETRLRQLGS